MTLLELTLGTAIREAGEFKDVHLSKEDVEYILSLLKEQEERCEQCAYKLYSAKEIEKNSNLNELWKPKD